MGEVVKIGEQEINIEVYRELLLSNLWLFHKQILQKDNPTDQMGEAQRELCNLVDHWTKNKKLILIPRGHLKSATITVGYAVQQICKNPNLRILIGSETNSKAKDFLKNIRDIFEKNDRLKYFFGNHQRTESRWTDDEITSNQRTSTAIKEPTVFTTGTDQTRTGAHTDVAIIDDPTSHTNISEQGLRKTLQWYREISNNILDPGGKLIVIGCLTGDTKILMSNGSWKKIKDIVPGESVWSRECKKLIKKHVSSVISQGKWDTVIIKTGRQSITATPNHPFLTRNGEWKRADDLKVGEAVICSSQVPVDTTKRDKTGMFIRNEHIWFLGFLFGDGWLIKSKKRIHGVGFAKSIYPELNERACKIAKEWFGKKPVENIEEGNYRIDSAKAYRILEHLGFQGKAKTKRIPEWIFYTRTSMKKSFIKGVIDADGCKLTTGYGYRVEMCNKELIEDLYWLSLTCGVRPTSIFHRERIIQAPNSPSPIIAKTWSIGLTFEKRQRYGSGMMVWDRITEIKKGNEEEVYDLTVEDTHNFIANGFVTHNTRWHFADIFQHIIDEQSEFFDIVVRQAISDEGYDILRRAIPIEEKREMITKDMILFPEKFTVDRLWEIYSGSTGEGGIEFFNNQYMNKIVSSENADFRDEDLRWYDPAQLKKDELNIYITIDPAISEKQSADFSVIMAIGVNEKNDWYVLDYDQFKGKPNELIDRTFRMYLQYPHTRKIGVETTAYQKSLVYSFRDEMRKREVFLPITEIKGRSQQGTKEIRMRGVLNPMIKQRRLHLQSGMIELREQLRTFPRCKNDDLIDALSSLADIQGGYKYQKGEKNKNETREQKDDREAAKTQPWNPRMMGRSRYTKY